MGISPLFYVIKNGVKSLRFLINNIITLEIITIKKLCVGAKITLQEFFDRDYFNKDDDVYK